MRGDAIDLLLGKAREHAIGLRRPLGSTYRVQFHAGFTFNDATAIVPYLSELGITHLYASPYLRAVHGSTHGYDVVDHNQLNPDLGTPADYDALVQVLASHGMSQLLDTVPNHQGVDGNDNAWWNDVLEFGRAAEHAKYFDIDWKRPGRPSSRGRVLLPILGKPYGEALESGQFKIVFRAENGRFFIQCDERLLPIAPSTYGMIFPGFVDFANADPSSRESIERAVAVLNGIPGQAKSFDALDALLSRQHYRLAYWKVAPDEINYRRFFDINGLAALAMERTAVFKAAHALTLRLAAEGKVSGLRIDHPDGLYDPEAYLRALQNEFIVACAHLRVEAVTELTGTLWEHIEPQLGKRLAESPIPARSDLPLYVSVEKILASDEPLPTQWACHGTSGYDFLNKVNGLFVNPDGESPLTELYQGLTAEAKPFEDLAYQKKLLILDRAFPSELHSLTRRLERLTTNDRRARDFPRSGLHEALRQMIACFPVYRTYITSPQVTDADAAHVGSAFETALRRNPTASPVILEWVRDLLLQKSPDSFTPRDRKRQLRFTGRFQQLTSPTTAKGVEDTAFYLDQRFISLNEVGGDPARLGVAIDELHAYFTERQREWPTALSALSTHDTKRSEDVRARLNVLSEFPSAWKRQVTEWMSLNASHRSTPDGLVTPTPDEEYLIYQTIVGAWPLPPCGPAEFTGFVQRVCDYLVKATREAKLRTSWTDPNEPHEKAIQSFITRILDPKLSAEFLGRIREFIDPISRLGLFNSLSQTLLRLTAPGVPDTYQGMELWDFSLVDPDNRRPVDYDRRRRLATEEPGGPASALALLGSLEDGRAKYALTRKLLRFRRGHIDLFSDGRYIPLPVTGERAKHAFAFARHHRGRVVIIVVPRLMGSLPSPASAPIGKDTWADTSLSLAGCPPLHSLVNLVTGERLTLTTTEGEPAFAVADALANFPVGAWANES